MRVTQQYVYKLLQFNLAGFAALFIALVCGGLYLFKIFIPAFSLNGDDLVRYNGAVAHETIILGSGLTLMLALISIGAERRVWPGIAAICVLLVTENLVFPIMPVWTLMLLFGQSTWAGATYRAAFVLASALVARPLSKRINLRPAT